MHIKTKFRLLIATLLLFATTLAADIEFPDLPLFIKEQLPPNIILTLDNSTSMKFGSIHEADVRCSDNRYCKTAPAINRLYYNPDITYEVPPRGDGTSFPPGVFNGAKVDGFNSGSATVDLGNQYRPTREYLDHVNDGIEHTFFDIPADINGGRAYYVVFNPTIVDPVFGSCDIDFDNNFNSPHADLCFDVFSVPTAQEQNFANWYSYYRTRFLTTKSAAAISFNQVSPEIRVGWNDINVLNSFSEANGNFVAPFTGGHRDNFYAWLANMQKLQGTPLIEAMQTVGEYMSTTDNINPFATTPGAADHNVADDLSCRQNFNVVFTDGAWGPINSVDRSPSENFDNQSTTLPDGTAFAAGTPPYSSPDPAYGFLADWAFRFWSTDLRPDLENNLPPYLPNQSGTEQQQFFNPENDPATWQHLVNYTVTLGVDGVLDFPEAFPSLVDGSLQWPTFIAEENAASEATRIDDTWHAAVNSRGDYFSASNTSELNDSFAAILNRINDRDATASAITTDSTLSASTEFIYRASFSTGDWSGSLQGFNFTNLIVGDQIFDSACRLTGGFCESDGLNYGNPQEPNGAGGSARRIISAKLNGDGIPFRLTSLDEEQREFFGPNTTSALETIQYLRGSRLLEESQGGAFRDRNSVLGDIINSSPTLVFNPQRAFPNRGDWDDLSNAAATNPENAEFAENFSDFEDRVRNRQRMVYVGANDGMLHAFNGIDGTEAFAYIPSVIQNRLINLTDPNYTHEFFVDGTPTAGDVYFETDRRWHSVLVGHLRSGGQMLYALEVTNPPAPGDTETEVANRLLWEFTHPDLGFGNGSPEIARMHDGSWVAIFGNGYSSSEDDGNAGSGEASLFIVDIRTGNLLKHIRTGVGSATNPNGLGSTTAVDIDGDFIVDYIYSGDLQGNMWKFDVTDTNRGPVDANNNAAFSGWRIANRNGAGPIPFFKATSSTGPQAITERPNVILHPIEGLMVIFGTGRYLEEADNVNNTVVNSFYGVWDRNQPEDADITLARNDLAIRILSADSLNAGGDTVVRSLSGESIDYSELEDLGWYFDFFPGELQFTRSTQFNFNLVAFTTFEPSLNECVRGGVSFLFVVSTFQGNDPGFIPLDINGDNMFDADDRLENEAIASAKRLEGGGVIAPLTILSSGSQTIDNQVADRANILATDLDGNPVGGAIQDLSAEQRGGRVQWRQLK